MKYEDKVKKLEKIVEKVNSSKLSLDESLKLYEESIVLAKSCMEDLSEYKGKMTILNSDLEQLKIDFDE